MEIDENNGPEQQDDSYVEIYSKWAIFGFSIFPSFIFGGVLLMLNLYAAGFKKAVYIVLIFLLAYLFAIDIITSEILLAFKINIVDYKVDLTNLNKTYLIILGLSTSFNVIGGLILTQYFFRKYFPDNDYYPKSIAKPVLIIVAVLVLGRLLMG